MNNILNKTEIVLIKTSGSILSEAIKNIASSLRAGMTTWDVDQIAEKYIVSKGGEPSFKNYFVEGYGHYPSAICISINHEVVHGKPSKDKIINEGDLVSIDLGVRYKGLCTDMAVTLGVGKISPEAQGLLETTKLCLDEGIKMAQNGNYTGDIGHAVQTVAEAHGYGVVRALVGHGIGRKPHLPPQIPNFGDPKTGLPIKEGMALAIEPMITMGNFEVEPDQDGWTVITKDRSLAAHFEHTVVIVDGNPVIVTE